STSVAGERTPATPATTPVRNIFVSTFRILFQPQRRSARPGHTSLHTGVSFRSDSSSGGPLAALRCVHVRVHLRHERLLRSRCRMASLTTAWAVSYHQRSWRRGVRPFRAHPNADAHVIEFEQLTKQYGDVVAVDGLSLQVQPGEVYAL